MAFNNFFYDQQISRYLIHFMMIFSGMQVRVGKNETKEERLIPVPIHYGSKDKVTASILAENTQNKPIRLPVMSTYLTAVELAPELRKGVGQVERFPVLPRGGVLPDDITIVKRMMPVPYWATTEVVIHTSNMDQHHQILEQILMIFDPILQVQTSDAPFDWTKIVMVELIGISFDENYPAGTDRRNITSTLTFRYPIWISAPSELKKNFVKELHIRLSIVDTDVPLDQHLSENLNAENIVADILINTDHLFTPPETEE